MVATDYESEIHKDLRSIRTWEKYPWVWKWYDAYSSMAPDPTSDIFRGPCTPILWFVFPIGLMRLITDCYVRHFISNRTFKISITNFVDGQNMRKNADNLSKWINPESKYVSPIILSLVKDIWQTSPWKTDLLDLFRYSHEVNFVLNHLHMRR
jgi:hypothetical protein